MKEWKLVKLGDIASINPDSLNKDYPYELIDYVDISSVGTGYLRESSQYLIKEAPSRAKRLVKPNDTILSTVRPNRRSFVFLKEPKKNQVVSTGFAVLRANETIDPRYLYYIISNQSFTDYLVSREQGAAYPAVNVDVIKDADIVLPDIETQKEISSVLGAFDDKINLNIKKNQTLEEIAMTLYKHWFVDFGPFQDGEFVESEAGMIPKGWEVRTIGDLATVSSGKRPSTINENGEIPIYGGAGKMGNTDDYLYNEDLFVIGRVGAYCGKEVFRVSGKSWASDNALVIKPLKEIFYSFLYAVLSDYNFDLIKGGSSQPLITQTGVKNIKTVFPTDEIMKRFEDISRKYHDLFQNNEDETKNLMQTRDYLLPKLLSGEVDLSNAEKEMEKVL